jgi:hypothetical protein
MKMLCRNLVIASPPSAFGGPKAESNLSGKNNKIASSSAEGGLLAMTKMKLFYKATRK